ncbi:MAG TPA: choice-of-anchor Q domain-containing protein, partial [Dehalococcoidia bacterium]|nr:choice-of-anchor Q domain-containing protein [Dehalococcoidia bacterium]
MKNVNPFRASGSGWPRVLVLVSMVVFAAVLALPGAPAHAVSFQVTKTADTMDGVCDADCSLREAVSAANATNDSLGYSTINLPAGIYGLTIPGPGEDSSLTGDLDVTVEMEISGAGADSTIIDGNGIDRVLQVFGGGVFALSGVTIRNGYNASGGGGGLDLTAEAYINGSTISGNFSATAGGGIYNSGYLQINNSTVIENIASSGLFGGIGGGVYTAAGSLLAVSGSTISANGATAAGGISNEGGTAFVSGSTITGNNATFSAGGIGSTGPLSVTNSVVNGNSSLAGGGIWISGTSATITDTFVNGNYGGAGGGIYVYNGALTVMNSTVSNNRGSDGGGIINASSTTTVQNSTISGNIANNGGGLYNDTNTASISHSTFSGNGATGAGGAIYISSGGMAIRDSIVANSTSGGNCGGFPVTSNDFNLSSDGTCPFAGKGDMQNTNPLLGPLVFNGGPTPTHALMDGSPAADAAGVPCPGMPEPTAMDQRGVTRPQGFRCDIGAFEAPDTDADGASDPRDPDDDNDSKSDLSDPCPLAAEDYDSFQDTDGCPDPDNDGDGIIDPADVGTYCSDPAFTLTCPTQDCRDIGEDLDAFRDWDGCPEPDNDNDGFPDATDACPGTSAQAGANGMLGSPQDLNHNGIRDGAEATLTSDDSVLTFEDNDGVLDTDGCHDSPGEDFDGDGFTDDAEALTIGTNAGYPCGYNSWPADLWDQPPLSANKITVQDLTSFIAPVRRLNTSAGNPNFS